MKKIVTAEQVTKGHPDKLCDLISDIVLDSYLEKDKNARVAVETVASKKVIFITGEISSLVKVNIRFCVKKAFEIAGYLDEYNFDEWKVITKISKQSSDIAQGVNESQNKKLGAGDQGIVYGYATNETENFMPLPYYLATNIVKRLTYVRENKIIDYLNTDGKALVSINYENEIPQNISSIVVSTCHKDINIEKLRKDIKEKVIDYVIPKEMMSEQTKIFINPTGKFTIGGPIADSGLTGRKIMVDTYGSIARHGGGAFSGKDYTKVDRSGAYMARFIAKNIVANNLADKCEVALSFAIGVEKPIGINIETFNTNKIPLEEIYKKVEKIDLSLNGIIELLNLKNIKYQETTNYGHFGKENMPWEKVIEL